MSIILIIVVIALLVFFMNRSRTIARGSNQPRYDDPDYRSGGSIGGASGGATGGARPTPRLARLPQRRQHRRLERHDAGHKPSQGHWYWYCFGATATQRLTQTTAAAAASADSWRQYQFRSSVMRLVLLALRKSKIPAACQLLWAVILCLGKHGYCSWKSTQVSPSTPGWLERAM